MPEHRSDVFSDVQTFVDSDTDGEVQHLGRPSNRDTTFSASCSLPLHLNHYKDFLLVEVYLVGSYISGSACTHSSSFVFAAVGVGYCYWICVLTVQPLTDTPRFL
jgi:hypothetical protein